MHLAYALPMTGRAHGAGRRNGQDMKWLQEVRRMGTTADKVAALTLLLQESAVSNLRSLDELLRWVSKRSGARAVAGQVRHHCCFHVLLLQADVEHFLESTGSLLC